jgi:RNA polymerase sigma factor for flagellar operon FliA
MALLARPHRARVSFRRVGDEPGISVARHLDLVRRIAGRVHRDVSAHIEYDDLVSLGTQGLMQAARRYDPERGTAFAGFAYYRIRGAIYDGLRAMGRLPPDIYRRALAAERADQYLENRAARATHDHAPGSHARSPSGAAGPRELSETLRSVTAIYVVSMAAIDLEEADISDPDATPADDQMARGQLRARLRQAIARLPERERHLIKRCYFDDLPLGHAGQELGLSASWTSRLHARAVDRLRDLLADELE